MAQTARKTEPAIVAERKADKDNAERRYEHACRVFVETSDARSAAAEALREARQAYESSGTKDNAATLVNAQEALKTAKRDSKKARERLEEARAEWNAISIPTAVEK